MDTALSTLSVLPSTKKEGEQFSQMLISEIKTAYSPLPILVQLKVMEKVLKEVLSNDDLDNIFLSWFKEDSEDNKLTVNGATLTSQEFGSKYDYSSDDRWKQLEEKIKELTAIKKDLEEKLKSDKIKIGGKQKVVCKL